MTETEAIALVQRLLTDSLADRAPHTTFVRDLAGRIGQLEQTMRSVLTILDHQAGGAR